ncbi:MAG: hypothetical protein ABEH81_11600 [Halopenitus sp.]
MTEEESAASSVAARDDVAGIVDLFGTLTRAELRQALSELAFKQGADADPEALDAAVAQAIREYHLVPVDAASPDQDGAAPEGDKSRATDDTVATTAAEDGVGTVADDDELAVGPTAFPSLPPNAEDLPHILDVEERDVDREALAERVHDRLVREVDVALAEGDADRLETLLDVTYDLEAWAPVEADDVRERIESGLED